MYEQAFIKNRNRVTLLALAVVTAALLSLILAKPTHAQEINPAPGSYSYGSTSEFSPFATLGQGTPNNGGSTGVLASTGQSQVLGYLVVGLLLIGAGTITYLSLRKRKHASTTKTDQAS